MVIYEVCLMREGLTQTSLYFCKHNNGTCMLDNNLSGEAMATKVLGTINGRLKLLQRKQNF